MKKTKIICSIGPASSSVEVMSEMVKNGMNVARINCSHATKEEKINVVASVKEVRKITGENIAILYDTKGPEFRNGMLENDEIYLVEGKTIRLVKKEVLGNTERFSVNHPTAIDSLKVGNIVLLENGLMELEVISKEEDGVTCKITAGGVLGNKKSLSAPGINLNIPFISEQDKEDIIYACNHDGDFIALSFVNTAEDVLATRKICEENGRSDMKLISKIESATGIENLESIVGVSDGIMVARGDLGVEVPMQQLPILQKKIIKACREHSKIAVVATEMLESMKKNVRPTRAEVSDVANAVLDGTDAVMLSGETTTGLYPIETVGYMASICEEAEKSYDYSHDFKDKRTITTTNVIAKSVVSATELEDINVIVAATLSGYTARRISNYKPKALIFAVSTSEATTRALALNWGVYTAVVPMYNSTDEVVESSKKQAIKKMNLNPGDKIIITGGFPAGKVNSTNFMRIEEI